MPLDAAGVGVDRAARPAHAAVLMRMAKGKIIKAARRDLLARDRIVALLRRVQVGMQHAQPHQSVLRRMEAREQARLLRGRGERRAVHGAAQLRQLHALDLPRFENMHVFRPRKRRIERTRRIKIVVARRNEYTRTHAAERFEQLFDRFAVGRLAVEQVSGEQHHVDPVLVDVICEPFRGGAALAAAQLRLLGAERAERAVEVKVRRVNDPDGHGALPFLSPLWACRRRPSRRSWRSISPAPRRSFRWRCCCCPRRETPSQSAGATRQDRS